MNRYNIYLHSSVHAIFEQNLFWWIPWLSEQISVIETLASTSDKNKSVPSFSATCDIKCCTFCVNTVRELLLLYPWKYSLSNQNSHEEVAINYNLKTVFDRRLNLKNIFLNNSYFTYSTKLCYYCCHVLYHFVDITRSTFVEEGGLIKMVKYIYSALYSYMFRKEQHKRIVSLNEVHLIISYEPKYCFTEIEMNIENKVRKKGNKIMHLRN